MSGNCLRSINPTPRRQFTPSSSALYPSTLGSPSWACTTGLCSRSPAAVRESSAAMSSTAPGPLSRFCQQITKDEAVGQYLSQKSRFTTGH
ncbi:hypothetical protein SKAU_G00375710 [Synaphobranchus kaupii]|uniref:Uncharacterized protein n=1 Tax=Synaphobranchus kaupii TaxID=118154 RepID=A0A9Q1EGY9_SYNKA|nr:hypothetical protein SKAU_G00375710 [Synaphobranchus kaupii]